MNEGAQAALAERGDGPDGQAGQAKTGQPGQRLAPSDLVDLDRLTAAYYDLRPDPAVSAQRIAFGTSGHRGSALAASFNEAHILAVTQAICLYRAANRIGGPLYMGFDTHALSMPAFRTALEVLAANGVTAMIAQNDEYTPTPAISHAVLAYNRGRRSDDAGRADGIVITPSHNPPADGGFKYNTPNGGPADAAATGWIEAKANELLEAQLRDVRRIGFEQALKASTTQRFDFLNSYIDGLAGVIDMQAIAGSDLRLCVDPLGGAGINFWPAIAERYKLNLHVIARPVDMQFGFMSADWDGKIRMDPSSAYAMQELIGLRQDYDVAFACDTDHDRHGIVTRSGGLMPANHYLSVAIEYLFTHRPRWRPDAGVGKTLVSSQMIDRVAARVKRPLVEMPVGFKWFSDGLLDGSLGFGGEESAGASFLSIDGSAWSTDKDGITAALLAAEMTAVGGADPAQRYEQLTQELGRPYIDRVDAPASPEQKKKLSKLSPEQVQSTELAGEAIVARLTAAPANQVAFGGLKVVSANGWFAARPSGTEDIYKIYGESFRDEAHLQRILREARDIVTAAIGN
ncbi:alpha-D-glucose phosphate-specific phosphoglucomutase [Oxalobacteraceae bacterium CAVE-383]|nr:alpha-D-glucose phosphate-specific phosphoglucomutase [Oxalobacteraceae bacterium CAVE-383]